MIARGSLGTCPRFECCSGIGITTKPPHKNLMKVSEKLLGTICCVEFTTRSADFLLPLRSRVNLFGPQSAQVTSICVTSELTVPVTLKKRFSSSVPKFWRPEIQIPALCELIFVEMRRYEGRLESKERFAIKKYLLIIGKKRNMQVLSHTFTYFSTQSPWTLRHLSYRDTSLLTPS